MNECDLKCQKCIGNFLGSLFVCFLNLAYEPWKPANCHFKNCFLGRIVKTRHK